MKGGKVTVTGNVTCSNGVLRVSGNVEGEVKMVYRQATQRWLVVASTTPTVPSGSTMQLPDDASVLLGQQTLCLQAPEWTAVVSEEELQQRIGALDVSKTIAEIVGDKCKLKQPGRQPCFAVLAGPQPMYSKASYAKARHDLCYDESVVLSASLLIYNKCAGDLFQRLLEARKGALHNAAEMEAFLVESSAIFQAFRPFADEILWKRDDSALHIALARGADVTLEARASQSSASIERCRFLAAKANYRLAAYSFTGSAEALRERAEVEFRKELEQGLMLALRLHSAEIDAEIHDADLFFVKLHALCDGAIKVDTEELSLGESGQRSQPNTLALSLRREENRGVAATLAKFTALMAIVPILGLLICERILRAQGWSHTSRWACSGFVSVTLVNAVVLLYVAHCFGEESSEQSQLQLASDPGLALGKESKKKQ